MADLERGNAGAAGIDDGGGPAAERWSAREWDVRWRSAIAHAMARSGKSRKEIAAEMSEALGLERPMTRAMLDAYASPARRGWRFPVAYLPAFIAVTSAHWLLHVLAIPCGRRVITRNDERALEIGRVAAEIDRLKRREAELLRAN